MASQINLIPVKLNNGSKWEADELTKLGIKDISAALGEIDVTATGENYQILYNNLSSSFKQAYKSSELDGDAKTQVGN